MLPTNNRLRITYIHQYFTTPDGTGGTRSYEFARRLIASGHDVHMITSSARLPYCSAKKVLRQDMAGIPTTVIHVPYHNAMPFNQRIRAFFRFSWLASREVIKHKADVVFATSTPLTIAIPGILAKLRHRVPMVFEVRDLWPELPIALGALNNPLAKVAAQGLEWIAYHSSAHIVALSPGMAEGVMRRGISAARISIIPNSCDIDVFDAPMKKGEAIREKLNLRSAQPLIVYAGSFGLIYGLDYFVEIAAAMRSSLPKAHFLMVGEGATKDAVVARAKQKGLLEANLTIWNPIPKAQLADVLAAATVATSIVIPEKRLWDNSANKFFDALAAGKPIAINYGGWQADLLNETGAGIVLPPDDPAEGARQLAEFVQDSARLRSASEAARHLARTRFDRDMMASQLEAILCSVVKKK